MSSGFSFIGARAGGARQGIGEFQIRNMFADSSQLSLEDDMRFHNTVRRLADPSSIPLWQLVVASLALLAVIIFGLRDARREIRQVDSRVDAVEESMLAAKFVVTSPLDESRVDVTVTVRGESPFIHKKHFVIVTPVETADDWVQDSPAVVHAGGTFTGRARLGVGAHGVDEQFLIRILATESTLEPGQLMEIPEDAISSRSVVVTRVR